MSVSNKALLIAVSVTLAITFIGMFLTISSFSSLHSTKELPSTGYASSTSGNVSIRITKILSITTIDSQLINFSGCNPGNVIYSNVSGGNANTDCPYFSPASIIVRNNGAYEANITINATNWGEEHNGTFVNATTDDSWIAYSVKNDSSNSTYNGGCVGWFQSDWVNITNGSMMRVCDNLAAHVFNNSVSIDVAIYVPPTTNNEESEVLFTIWANQIW